MESIPVRSWVGPAGLPLVGHLPAYLRDRLGFLVRCAADYGEVVPLRIGPPTWLLTSPDDIRHVLVTRQDRYVKSVRIRGRGARRALGSGLLTSTGAEHRQFRRLLQPVFHRTLTASLASTISAAATETVAAWTDGATLDVSRAMRELAQRVMIESLLGRDGHTEPLARAVTSRRRYYEHLLTATLPFPHYQPTRARREYPKAQAVIDEVLAGALRTRRAAGDASVDLLAMLCAVRDAEGAGMSDAQVRDEVLTFLDTGYETISVALAWTCLLLSQHSDCQRRLADEVRGVIGDRVPSGADVPALRYTGLVISEALRLYPPTWMFVRIVSADDTLPSGAPMAVGDKLILCPYIPQHDARHFPEPERFVPERFERGADPGRPIFSYFPFGGGPHTCIGEPFARMECAIVLAAIAQRFVLAPDPGQHVTLEAGTALRPRPGVRVRLAAVGAGSLQSS